MWLSLLCPFVMSSCPVGSPPHLAPREPFAGAGRGGQWLGECACGGVTHLAPVSSRSSLVSSLLDSWGGWLAPVRAGGGGYCLPCGLASFLLSRLCCLHCRCCDVRERWRGGGSGSTQMLNVCLLNFTCSRHLTTRTL